MKPGLVLTSTQKKIRFRKNLKKDRLPTELHSSEAVDIEDDPDFDVDEYPEQINDESTRYESGFPWQEELRSGVHDWTKRNDIEAFSQLIPETRQRMTSLNEFAGGRLFFSFNYHIVVFRKTSFALYTFFFAIFPFQNHQKLLFRQRLISRI